MWRDQLPTPRRKFLLLLLLMSIVLMQIFMGEIEQEMDLLTRLECDLYGLIIRFFASICKPRDANLTAYLRVKLLGGKGKKRGKGRGSGGGFGDTTGDPQCDCADRYG